MKLRLNTLPKAKTDLQNLKTNTELNEENIRSIFRQLKRAMEYLYFVREVRHHDLKPSNILVDYDQNINGTITNIKVHLWCAILKIRRPRRLTHTGKAAKRPFYRAAARPKNLYLISDKTD